MSGGNGSLVSVRNLKKYFPIVRGTIIQRHVGDCKAVDDVSFYIQNREILGLVGESGCGKTTIAKAILNLVESTRSMKTTTHLVNPSRICFAIFFASIP